MNRLSLRLAGIRRSVAALPRWRRAVLLFVLGGAATLALPPLYAFPALVVALPPLVWAAADARSLAAAFRAGLWFGWGYFAFGLYWMTFAVLVRADAFAWLVPVAVPAVSAFLALFVGGTTLGVEICARRFGLALTGRVFLFAAFWTAAEWLRGHVLTGFPWNALGTAAVGWEGFAQSGAVIGMFGLSLLVAAMAAMPAALADGARASRRGSVWTLAVTLVLPALLSAAGWVRVAGGDGGISSPPTFLRIVQANIPQTAKWDANEQAAHFIRHLELSARPVPTPAPIGIVIWPESATPYYLDRDPAARRAIAGVVPPGGFVVTGTVRLSPKEEEPVRAWNSIEAVDGDGAVVAGYDKFHLVPFGEFMPFRDVIPFDTLTEAPLDFSRGPGPVTLHLDDLPPFSPLICYEIIFPGRVIDPVDRPEWILNVTNDAWFGITAGPHQHFAQARLRAIEQGLPVVRAANNGISAVIDSHGRVAARLALGTDGVLDAALPSSLPPTVYGRWGDRTLTLMLIAAVLLAFGAGRNRG